MTVIMSASMGESGQLIRIMNNTTRLRLTSEYPAGDLQIKLQLSSRYRHPRLCGDMRFLAQCRQHVQDKKNEVSACSSWGLGIPAGAVLERLDGVLGCHTAASP